MLGSLATVGYASKRLDAERLIQEAFAVNRKALLIDTRLVPSCRWDSRWQRSELEQRYKQRYQWKGKLLGNIHHYDPALPVQLANEEAGISWLVSWLERGVTLILLCACADYERCHRKVIYEKVKAQMRGRLPDFVSGQRVITPCGAGVIDSHIPLEVHRARNRYAVVHDVWNPQRYFFPDEITPLDEDMIDVVFASQARERK
jgi:hypothetical protein